MLVFPEDIKLESTAETDKAISLFRETSKTIKSRLILLSFLFVTAVGFLFYVDDQKEKSWDYYVHISRLESLRDTSDMKAYLQLHESTLESDLYFVSDIEQIIYKIKQSDYKDKAPVLEGIAELKKIRNTYFDSLGGQSIGLFGISVPLPPLLAVATLILLLIYHEYAQKSYYRLRLAYAFKVAQIPDWKINPEGLPLEDYQGILSPSTVFMDMLSKVIISIINFLVLVTGFLFIRLITETYKHEISNLLSGISGIFLGILLIEVAIVCFQNNYFGIQNVGLAIHYCLHENPSFSKFKQRLLRILWIPFCISVQIYIALIAGFFRIDFVLTWFLLIPMCSILPISYYLKHKYAKSFIVNMLLFTGIVCSVYWLFFVPVFTLFVVGKVNEYTFQAIALMGFGTIVVSFVISFVYARIVKKIEIRRVRNSSPDSVE